MKFRLRKLLRHAAVSLIYSMVGAAVVLVVVFVVYLDSRPDLAVWHTADLDEEFTTRSKADSFSDYLALEDRLFRQLDERVYERVAAARQGIINRYTRGSLSDPTHRDVNWNRSFELSAPAPAAGILLLHGMSDSPYSLRHLGQRLNAAGAHVVGMRMPGHGTAPVGLVELGWQDMTAAVRLAVRHLSERLGDKPLYIIGYSTGAALGVHYALETLSDTTLPRVDRLAIMSPAIGVASVAALAVWQARLGHLLGLEKLAWNAILPEYDPYKYGSFAVNAGDVVYQLTLEIQRRIDDMQPSGRLRELPSILAFSSVVDATVSTPALVSGLFQRLPGGKHELVVFDYNRLAGVEQIMKEDPAAAVWNLLRSSDRPYTLSVVSNQTTKDRTVALHQQRPGQEMTTTQLPDLSWPDEIYSLAHVALPFPMNDELYGGYPPSDAQGIKLGNIALRGERGILHITASEMLRLRWNPFYPYLEERVLEFLGLGSAVCRLD